MLRTGALCQIRYLNDLPVLAGAVGQVVDLQTQENEMMAYPLWVHVLTGTSKGRTVGCDYGEIEFIAPPLGVPLSPILKI